MKMHTLAATLFASFASLMSPALALACPGARAASGCAPCGGSASSYLLAVGVGLLAGAGSVALEGALKKRG